MKRMNEYSIQQVNDNQNSQNLRGKGSHDKLVIVACMHGISVCLLPCANVQQHRVIVPERT